MRALMKFALLPLLIVTLFVLTPARADSRVALVIGNAQYQHVPVLANPVSDANLVAAAFKRAGFVVTVRRDLTKAGIEGALREFARQAAGADIAAVYFAGHGMEADGVNRLIPVDAKLETRTDVDFETVPLSQVKIAVGGARKLKLIVLDACRNNLFAARLAAEGTRSLSRGLARIEPDSGMLVAYAAKDGTTAVDGDGNSPYAKALAAQLVTPGLEVQFVFRRVHDAVMAATGQRQEPGFDGSLGGEEIYLIPGAPPAPLAAPEPVDPRQMEITFWQSVQNSNDAAQLQTYLDAYPQGTFAALAKVKINALIAKAEPAPGSAAKIATVPPPPSSSSPPEAVEGKSVSASAFDICANQSRGFLIFAYRKLALKRQIGDLCYSRTALYKQLIEIDEKNAEICNAKTGRLCTVSSEEEKLRAELNDTEGQIKMLNGELISVEKQEDEESKQPPPKFGLS